MPICGVSRLLRIAVENGWYHVLNRGINGRQLFPDDHAKRAFHLNPVRIKRLGGQEARAGAEQRLESGRRAGRSP